MLVGERLAPAGLNLQEVHPSLLGAQNRRWEPGVLRLRQAVLDSLVLNVAQVGLGVAHALRVYVIQSSGLTAWSSIR